jgi:hypothetical protein
MFARIAGMKFANMNGLSKWMMNIKNTLWIACCAGTGNPRILFNLKIPDKPINSFNIHLQLLICYTGTILRDNPSYIFFQVENTNVAYCSSPFQCKET